MVSIINCTVRMQKSNQNNSLKGGQEQSLYQRLALLLLAMAAMVSLIYLKGRQPVEPTLLATFSASEDIRQIQIAGDVAHPGIYSLSSTDLVTDLMTVARPLCGGEIPDENIISLMETVQSGDQLWLSCDNATSFPLVESGSMAAAHLITLGLQLDLNTATQSDLQLLPGIGPTLAMRIVEYRQQHGDFKESSDLMLVHGIGEKKFNQISRFVK